MGRNINGNEMRDVIISFLAAVLSGTGVGGGGLLVIYLSIFKDIAQSTAQGINLLFFEVSAIGALPLHVKERKMRTGIILLLGISGLFGATVGTKVAGSTSPILLKKAFGIFLIISGVISMFKK